MRNILKTKKHLCALGVLVMATTLQGCSMGLKELNDGTYVVAGAKDYSTLDTSVPESTVTFENFLKSIGWDEHSFIAKQGKGASAAQGAKSPKELTNALIAKKDNGEKPSSVGVNAPGVSAKQVVLNKEVDLVDSVIMNGNDAPEPSQPACDLQSSLAGALADTPSLRDAKSEYLYARTLDDDSCERVALLEKAGHDGSQEAMQELLAFYYGEQQYDKVLEWAGKLKATFKGDDFATTRMKAQILQVEMMANFEIANEQAELSITK